MICGYRRDHLNDRMDASGVSALPLKADIERRNFQVG